MQDAPTPDEILDSVSTFLREVAGKLPSREAFEARVAANALELVRRQLASADIEAQSDEVARRGLAQLLGRDGSLEDLNRILCERIASGELGLSNKPLMDLLWTTTLQKVRVDQPTYASFQRALVERGASR